MLANALPSNRTVQLKALHRFHLRWLTQAMSAAICGSESHGNHFDSISQYFRGVSDRHSVKAEKKASQTAGSNHSAAEKNETAIWSFP